MIVYAFLIDIIGSISVAFEIVGCFCYIIKCIPKKSNNGLFVGVFLSANILGKNLGYAFNSLTKAVDLSIVMYFGAIIMACCTFFLFDVFPIPSFSDSDLDLLNVEIDNSKIDMMMLQEDKKERGDSLSFKN